MSRTSATIIAVALGLATSALGWSGLRSRNYSGLPVASTAAPFDVDAGTDAGTDAGSFPTTGLAAYYKFDNNLTDSTDAGNDATDVSGTITYSAGILNQAVNCASGNRVHILHNGVNSFALQAAASGPFSISTWIFPPSLPAGYATLLTQNTSAVGLYLKSDGRVSMWDFAHGGDHLSAGTVSAAVWTSVVFTYAGASGAYKFYLNGVLSGSSSGVAFDATGVSWWFCTDESGANAFLGLQDETAVFTSAELSASDVTAIYNGGSPLPYP